MKVLSGKPPEAAKEEKAIQRKAKSSIIDNFILDQATKTPPKPKAEFYTAENMAKKLREGNKQDKNRQPPFAITLTVCLMRLAW